LIKANALTTYSLPLEYTMGTSGNKIRSMNPCMVSDQRSAMTEDRSGQQTSNFSMWP